MSKIVVMFLLLCFSLFSFADEDVKEDQKEEVPNYETVKSAIEGAIQALEKKETEKFFKEFVSPADLENLMADTKEYQEMKKGFMGSEKSKALLSVLKKLKDVPPIYDKEKDVLTFDSKDMSKISFSREDGKWYIKN